MKVEKEYYFQFFYLCLCIFTLSIGFYFGDNLQELQRGPANVEDCSIQQNCPFLIIGHRGAPHVFAENTISSFQEAIDRGANALEIDLAITKDKKVVVIHDRDPDDLIALARQVGLEGLPFIPYVPNLGSSWRIPVEKLTLYELLQHFGYARNEGIIHNILFEGVLENSAIIPPLSETLKSFEEREELQAIFLDIKLREDQEDLAEEMAEQINEMVSGSHYKLYISSPFKSIVNTFFDVLQKSHQQNYERPILDMESDGALKNIDEMGLEGLLTGKTILRSETSFFKEIDQLLGRKKLDNMNLYPIVAWTIDEQFMMYKLLQKGVDGIITNRPRDLARLIIRHWKDHSLMSKYIAKCFHDYEGFDEYQFCTSGREINPYQTISKREILHWVCQEEKVHEGSKDQFGCDFLNGEEVRFEDELDNSGQVNLWYSPEDGGSVVVHKTEEEFSLNKIPVLIQYREESCSDGFLNHECEYTVALSYRIDQSWIPLKTKKSVHESDFFITTNVPQEANELRVQLVEMDGEERKLRGGVGSLSLPLADGAFGQISSQDNTFRGTLKLQLFNYGEIQQSFIKRKTFGLEFEQRDCYDGFLNYDCEYRIKVEALDKNYRRVLKNQYKNFDSSFAFYSTIPENVQKLLVTIYETDDGYIDGGGKSQQTRIIDLGHGYRYSFKAPNETFKGTLSIKLFDYDEKREHSEGAADQPHNISLPHLENK